METIQTLETNSEKREIGDMVWFIEPFSNRILDGKIEDFLTTETHGMEQRCVRIHCSNFGHTWQLLNRTFLTKEDAIQFLKQKEDDLSQTYLNQISSIEDLVKFMYEHSVASGEETDWIARKVVEEKASEFGIKL